MEKVVVGQQVVYVDERRVRHQALVTIVWGESHLSSMGEAHGQVYSHPCVNLVYVSADESKDDQYGRQIERSTSVPHFRDSSAPGFCWFHTDEGKAAGEKLLEAETGVKR